jgi:uncharacterized integral membrane protein
MADPQIEEPLDGFDRLTVRLYRSGLFLFVAALAARVVALLTGTPDLALLHQGLLTAAAVASFSSLHIYDKRFRWVIALLAWLGLASGRLFGLENAYAEGLSTGLLLAAYSAVALKEYLCFRIFGLPLVPGFLVVATLLRVAGSPLEVWALVPVAVLMLLLGIAKVRMPLHFDVGAREHYSN